MQADVVQLPTELTRMRDADRLMRELIEIRSTLAGVQRTVALTEWSFRVDDHAERYRVVRKQSMK